MTSDRRISLTRHASKEVAQFAPNFTVYVLPPDVVCLYSEDRKFFLHGELYCALASALGKGARQPGAAETSASNILADIIGNHRAVPDIVRMNWGKINLIGSKIPLLTSDRPLAFVALS